MLACPASGAFLFVCVNVSYSICSADGFAIVATIWKLKSKCSSSASARSSAASRTQGACSDLLVSTASVRPHFFLCCCRYFTVVNLDRSYRKKPIAKRLAIDENDQESMRTLLKAQHRWLFDSEEKKVLTLEPLEISTLTARAYKNRQPASKVL